MAGCAALCAAGLTWPGASGAMADSTENALTASSTTTSSTTASPTTASPTPSTTTTTTTTTPTSTTTSIAGTTSTTIAGGTTSGTLPPSASQVAPPPSPAVNLAAIRAAQVAVISQRFQLATVSAELAVSGSELKVASDQQTLASDQAQASAAIAVEERAAGVLAADQAALQVATSADQQATSRLAGDRARLRGLALGLYTGALTAPPPPTLQDLATAQAAAIDGGEVNVVAQVVVASLSADIRAVAVDDRHDRQLTDTVSGDGRTLAADRGRAAAASSLVPPAAAALHGAQQRLTASDHSLAGVQAAEKAALAKVGVAAPNPPSAPGLSILGASALNADELTAWFSAQGYIDLTSSTITQLANWYLADGAKEGVRGDVAFAQAVLETGGFSSPDAVGLNNYAGIGHCDTCGQGWGFPSPEAGVLGHLQLLRIFAGGGTAPKPAPPPVLPALTPSKQGRGGCCPTWESLTGVWATDPSYGVQILTMYSQMLQLATTNQPSTPGT